MSASVPVSRIARTKDEMRPSSPRSSRISSTVARYSRLELAGLDARRLLVGPLDDLDAEVALRVGVGGAELGAVQAVQVHGPAAAGHAHALADLGDRADLGVRAVVARDEQHALLVADVDGDRDVHVGEDDEVVQRYEEQ